MINQSRNPQVLYSLQTLSESLLALMRNRPYEEITVSDICRKALITRRTFYRNCTSKKELLCYAIDNAIRAQIASVDWTVGSAKELYEQFFSYWKQKELLEILCRQQMFELFSERLVMISDNETKNRVIDRYTDGAENPSHLRTYYNVLVIGALCQLLRAWIYFDYDLPPEKMAEIMDFFDREKTIEML